MPELLDLTSYLAKQPEPVGAGDPEPSGLLDLTGFLAPESSNPFDAILGRSTAPPSAPAPPATELTPRQEAEQSVAARTAGGIENPDGTFSYGAGAMAPSHNMNSRGSARVSDQKATQLSPENEALLAGAQGGAAGALSVAPFAGHAIVTPRDEAPNPNIGGIAADVAEFAGDVVQGIGEVGAGVMAAPAAPILGMTAAGALGSAGAIGKRDRIAEIQSGGADPGLSVYGDVLQDPAKLGEIAVGGGTAALGGLVGGRLARQVAESVKQGAPITKEVAQAVAKGFGIDATANNLYAIASLANSGLSPFTTDGQGNVITNPEFLPALTQTALTATLVGAGGSVIGAGLEIPKIRAAAAGGVATAPPGAPAPGARVEPPPLPAPEPAVSPQVLIARETLRAADTRIHEVDAEIAQAKTMTLPAEAYSLLAERRAKAQEAAKKASNSVAAAEASQARLVAHTTPSGADRPSPVDPEIAPSVRSGIVDPAPLPILELAPVGSGAVMNKTAPGSPVTRPGDIHPVTEAVSATGETNRPFGMQEALELLKEIQGAVPAVRKLKEGVGGFYRYSQGRAETVINSGLAADPDRALRVVLEEGFHAVDHLDVADTGIQTLKRGNVAGRLLGAVKHLKDELRGPSGLYKNKVMRDELKRLTSEADPFDATADPKFTKYRHSPEELFARGMAEYVVNPGLVQRWAPEFYNAVNDFRENRPKFARAYASLNDMLAAPKAEIMARRDAKLTEMFTEGQEKRRAVFEAELAAKESESRIGKSIASLFDDIHAATLSFARDMVGDGSNTALGQWAGKRFNESILRVRNALERMKDDTGRKQHYMDIEREVYEPARAAGIPETDLGKIAMLRRIAFGDRSERFNPLGWEMEEARAQLAFMRDQMGPAKFAEAEALVRKALDKNQDAIQYAYERGLLSDDQRRAWLANPDYARFSVIEHIEKNMDADFRAQVGTFKGIEDPLATTIMQTDAVYRAADRNAAKLELAELAHKAGGREFVKPQMISHAEEGKRVEWWGDAKLKPG